MMTRPVCSVHVKRSILLCMWPCGRYPILALIIFTRDMDLWLKGIQDKEQMNRITTLGGLPERQNTD